MKLLIVTQKVDKQDSVLGFFHRWLQEFAKHCESVIVVCLEKGEHDLPHNVRVLSLGKEHRESRIKYVRNFYKYIRHERENYDAVFVHMNPIYVVLGGLFWRAWNKKIALWYTHKSVDLKLRLAEKLCNVIFTASKESFRLKSGKVIVTGHGIDISSFKCQVSSVKKEGEGKFDILSVGRISPIKKYEVLIEAVEVLVRDGIDVRLKIVGGPGTKEQSEYLDSLKKKVKDSGLVEIVQFVGEVSNKDIIEYLQDADLFVNLSQTGSLDKAVLEAMACGVPVLTSNKGLESTLVDLKDNLMFDNEDINMLSKKIKSIIDLDQSERSNFGIKLRSIVVENHNLSKLIKNLVLKMQ